MILVLDNRDSFVHNLARYVRELGEEAVVRRSDEMRIDEVELLAPTHIVIARGRARRQRRASPPRSCGDSDRPHPSLACASVISASAPPLAATSCARDIRCTARHLS